jgi:hypothetical protein
MRSEIFSRHKWTLIGLGLFMVMAVAIFWEALPGSLALLTPDSMPFFSFGYHTWRLENLLVTASEPTPHVLFWMMLPPLVAHKLSYIVDSLVLALAGVYYLRGRGVRPSAAWLGGLALAFSGYSFTIFSAGHLGYFDMFCCAAFAFGLLDRCFRKRQIFHFVMLGACLGWAVPYQADVLVMMFGLMCAYTFWLTFAPGVDPTTRPWQRVARVYPRFLISLVVALAIAAPGIKDVVWRQMGERASLRDTVSSSTVADASGEGKKHDKWIFATNWSLPPEDVAEFVVPGIFGDSSYQLPYPYWGRLGQSDGWTPESRTMPNYRQHTVYLGALSIIFGLFAALIWWQRRRHAELDGAVDSERLLLVDVPFWLVAGGVCLLLAMGRYTPFYTVFYAIPYMDLIRCPVKFHHLVEICAAFLFGIGVEIWLRGDPTLIGEPASKKAVKNAPEPSAICTASRILAGIALGCAVVLFFAAGITSVNKAEIVAHISRMGLGQVADELAGYLSSNLVRAALLFGVAAFLFWMGRARSGRLQPAAWLLLILALVFALDRVTVGQRYVKTIPIEPYYANNCVTDAALAGGGVGAGVANYATAGTDPVRDWFASSLVHNGLRSALPTDAKSDEGKVFQALDKRSPDVFWRVAHVRFVAAKWSEPAVAPMVQAHVLKPLISFMPGKSVVHAVQPAMDAFVLAEFTAATPDAYVVSQWQGGLNDQDQLRTMSAPEWNPGSTTLCDAPPADAANATNGVSRVVGQAHFRQRRGADFHLSTIVDVTAPEVGLLVVDEPYANDWVASVDGKTVQVRRANVLWCAVEVPAGSHVVTLHKIQQIKLPLISAVASIGVVLFAIVCFLPNGIGRRDGPVVG